MDGVRGARNSGHGLNFRIDALGFELGSVVQGCSQFQVSVEAKVL